jgi:transposase
MSDDPEDLKRRLVIGHESDGRSVYDESAKAELVALCMQPGASVSRLARECGVDANQVGRWLRENGQGRRRTAGAVDDRIGECRPSDRSGLFSGA